MSSLAAAQADGYYFPPEWSPDKGSLKKFTGSKGANQYEQRGEPDNDPFHDVSVVAQSPHLLVLLFSL